MNIVAGGWKCMCLPTTGQCKGGGGTADVVFFPADSSSSDTGRGR